MTVNDKLQNFRDINLEDARARLKEQLDACGAELDAAFEKHKEEREKAIREKLREEETVLRKELNRTFSQKQAEMQLLFLQFQAHLQHLFPLTPVDGQGSVGRDPADGLRKVIIKAIYRILLGFGLGGNLALPGDELL